MAFDTYWFMSSMGDRLRWVRRNARPRSLTQAALASRLQRTQTYVSETELGKRKAGPEEIVEWVEACGLHVFTLILARPPSDDTDELTQRLESANPESLNAVLDLLRALDVMPDVTRATVLAIIQSVVQAHTPT